MSTRFYKGAVLLALAATLAACAPTSPHWESSFGDSVRASVAAQVADPAAVRNTDPVAGIDGPAARAAQKRYEASFASPSAPEPSVSIGTGL